MANAVVTKRVLVNVANQAHVPPVVLPKSSVQVVAAKSLSRNLHVALMANAVAIKPAAGDAVKQVHVQLAAALRRKRRPDKFQSQFTLI